MTDKKSNDNRRKLLKSIAAGSGAVVAGKAMPESWTKPVIDSVLLPVHAATSTLTSICNASVNYDLRLSGDGGGGGYIAAYHGSDGCGDEIFTLQPSIPSNGVLPLNLSTGQYFIQFGGDGSGSGNGYGRLELVCCDASKVVEFSFSDGSGEVNVYLILDIGDDGTCSITDTTRNFC